jgi:hypothetical protein
LFTADVLFEIFRQSLFGGRDRAFLWEKRLAIGLLTDG